MRKRTHLRGILLGITAHVLLALVLAYIGAELTSLVSSAAGVTSPLKSGPFEPLSVGWFVSQPLVFAIGGVAGFVAAHFSPARSWKAVVSLAIGAFALASAALPSSESLVVLAAWLLLSPLGILLGAQIYIRKVENRDA